MIVGWGSSSMEGIGPALELALSACGRELRNLGKGGETSHHTAARMGALPPLLSFPDGVLPAAGSVPVTSVLDDQAVSLKPVAGTVAGMAGVLSPRDERVVFTREAPGAAVPLVEPVPFHALLGPELAEHDTLLWIGKNDLHHGDTPEGVVERTHAAADWLASRGTRVLVIGHFVNTGSPAELQGRVEATNAALAERYGEHFLDVNGPLTAPDVWERAGIAPTDEDRTEQAAGRKPPSLSADHNHLDMVGYHLVAGLIARRLRSLGWLPGPQAQPKP